MSNSQSDKDENGEKPDRPKSGKGKMLARGALSTAGGAIPFLGGLLSAAADYWSENDQEKINRFFEHCIRMLEDQVREQAQTIFEIAARLDMNDEGIAARVQSGEYQSLLKKAFRDWAAAESENKRVYVRNILTNAAATDMTSDDVLRLFLDWIGQCSELHFHVIGAIYNSAGITRGGVWEKIGKGPVREDSADADLYKLLFRDLSTGGVIRQHRETDYEGHFVKKRRTGGSRSSNKMKSAFDDEEPYELTQLGQQFVHYAMTDIPPRIEYAGPVSEAEDHE